MNRRTFVAAISAVTVSLVLGTRSGIGATPASPVAGGAPFPDLLIRIEDDGFVLPDGITAGRYTVTSRNEGTQPSHSALGRLPEGITDAELDALMQDDSANAGGFSFNDIGFVGLPDWPAPGSTASGVIDLAAGDYILFDPFGARGIVRFEITGEAAAATEPASDLSIELAEMSITFPTESIAAGSYRWKVSNVGAVWHEMALLPVPESLTGDQLLTLFALPDDATPPAGLQALEYNPVEAIGLIAAGHTSWVDVDLTPGRYVALCAAPGDNGLPHVMDGMFTFFTVA
jgi:hypothetical protein